MGRSLELLNEGWRSARRALGVGTVVLVGMVGTVGMLGGCGPNDVVAPMDLAVAVDLVPCSNGGLCNGIWTCLESSTSNCGSCNHACVQGWICNRGQCQKDCGPVVTSTDMAADADGGAQPQVSMMFCTDVQNCVDLRSDPMHCGSCTTACRPGDMCSSGRCITDCGAVLTLCAGQCVDVSSDPLHCGGCTNQCGQGMALCVDGQCGSACPFGLLDCQTGCIDPRTDHGHCGSCSVACSGMQVCSNQQCKSGCEQGLVSCLNAKGMPECVNLATDRNNCGGCKKQCGAEVCSNGKCQNTCGQGYTLCKDKKGDPLGCFDLTSDPGHCGSCPSDPPPPNSPVCRDQTPFCVAGKCVQSCPSKTCHGVCADTNTDPRNCGGCSDLTDPNDVHICKSSLVCSGGQCVDPSNCPMGTLGCGRTCLACTPANATPACNQTNFTCMIGICTGGYTDCNNDPSDGCEVHTSLDTANCGKCGTTCAVAHGKPTCNMGMCAVSSCDMGWSDCDHAYANGCEINSDSDVTNCGTCGTNCTVANGTPGCAKGLCGIQSCNPGFLDCDGKYATGCEVNTNTDVNNCGACSKLCTPANASPACGGGVCAIAKCNPNFQDCNNTPNDGCEANLTTDVKNCGACSVQCAAANATVQCATSTCGIASCDMGFGDCDKIYANGCETPLNTLQNCGTCGMACLQVQNGNAACNAGMCAIGGCGVGFAHCTTNPKDGCETNTQIDAKNCGNCGNVCPTPAHSTPSCGAGVCGFTCIAPYADCDGNPQNGCETDTSANAMNCGSCKNACMLPNAMSGCGGSICGITLCAAGYADCDKVAADGCEVNAKTDVMNCGACGNVCPTPPSASVGCTNGVCGVGTCNGGFFDCDKIAANGCEVNSKTDVMNCGACANICATPANATPGCAGGVCGIATCNAGFFDCDKTSANGCEVNSKTDVVNCGACANVCSTPANATPGCAAGMCGIGACNAGFLDCDKVLANGCEVSSKTDVMNCGACGNVCPTPSNGSPTCTNGVCGVGGCSGGFLDCDKVAANGCEVNSNTSVTNCGACGNVCPTPANATPGCAAGSCGIGACKAGFLDCDKVAANGCEVNLNTSVTNCGSCGNACPAPANATAGCTLGACDIGTCNTGFLDCDKMSANGCEVNSKTDVTNCGSCGNVCATPANATAGCAAGSCGIGTCNAGFLDCDKAVANGCEVNSNTSVNNCGACGNVCAAPANATAGCSSGSCGIGTCKSGFLDCDKVAANGCEVNLKTDVMNCGTCGNVCPTPTNATAACNAGVCDIGTCNAGFLDCDKSAANGCEVNSKTDVMNCGACANVCATPANATAGCATGSCGIGTCNTGFLDCDKAVANGCEINSNTNVNNCGACANVCAAPVNATAGCAAGTCGIGTCNTGFLDCDKSAANGCEVNSKTDVMNCGACANVCATPANATAGCAAGSCGIGTCNTGFLDCNKMASDGCEVNGQTDAMNCGSCAKTCPATANASTTGCSSGSCAVVSCSMGFFDCDKQYANGCECAGGCLGALCQPPVDGGAPGG